MAKRGRPRKLSSRLRATPKRNQRKNKKSGKRIEKPPRGIPARRKYEGASQSKRLSRWLATSTSANAEIQGGLVALRNRSRDLRRNNPWAAKGIAVITSNVIGPGIATQFRGANAGIFEQMWAKWAETTEIDFDGRNNIYGLQRLVAEAVVESGEVLIRKRFNSEKAFPLQYQVLESDFLDISVNNTPVDGNYVIQGIEFDPQGRRVAYYLFEEHPGGYDGSIGTPSSNRVPASEVQHVFRMDRPGQARGIPWLAPVIVRLKDLDDFEDATIMRAKIAACFTAFVRDAFADTLDVEADAAAPDLGDRMEPAIIEHLPPGKTIEFNNPPMPNGFGEFAAAALRAIAAGLQVTYEALTGDFSQVNFSSARMGWLEMGRSVNAWREHIILAHCLNPIADDFLGVAEIMGMNASDVTYVHVPPRREMFDPTKEIPAVIKGIRGGIMTLSDELMSAGKDPAAHLKQFKDDMDMLDALGLTVEGDPRVPMKSGGIGGAQWE